MVHDEPLSALNRAVYFYCSKLMSDKFKITTHLIFEVCDFVNKSMVHYVLSFIAVVHSELSFHVDSVVICWSKSWSSYFHYSNLAPPLLKICWSF